MGASLMGVGISDSLNLVVVLPHARATLPELNAVKLCAPQAVSSLPLSSSGGKLVSTSAFFLSSSSYCRNAFEHLLQAGAGESAALHVVNIPCACLRDRLTQITQ
jgi:hypothetical protein